MQLQRGSHAVVIGGSMAGLCAARALCAHFERVTLIERDNLPASPEHRRGVPQSHHVHALLLRGLAELERLFPAIERDLTAAGAVRIDMGSDFAHCTEWGWAPRVNVGVAPITMSRVLIEDVVRARLRRDVSNLEWRAGARVMGLTTERKGDHVLVNGVVTADGELRAELVIDASGRASKCLEWLAAAGVEPPEEELVDAYAGYASRFYELEPDPKRWWQAMIIDAKAPLVRRWGIVMPVEGGRCVVTVAGVNRDYPPGDEAGFLEYAKGLLSPELARELARAKAVSEIHTHQKLSNRRRLYERWARKVGGFVALGDSAIAFNPTHGQGMSMAAVAANALRDCLARETRDPYRLTQDFHKLQWKQLRIAWLFATGADLEWPDTLGKRPWNQRWNVSTTRSVVRAAHEDAEVKRAILPVFQLLCEPREVLSAGLIARVLRAEVRRRLGRSLSLLDANEFERLPAELPGA